MEKILAAVGTIWLVGSVAGYVFERDHFQNTLEVGRLVFWAVLVGILAAVVLIFLLKKRLRTWPEKMAVGFLIVLITPLKAEFLNRWGAEKGGHESFIFQREEARFAGLGLQKGEVVRPNQFILRLEKGGKNFAFKHRKHTLFPLTKTGEEVLLPFKKGRFGFKIIDLD